MSIKIARMKMEEEQKPKTTILQKVRRIKKSPLSKKKRK